ncbi:hypothetical protein K439DRAFT_1641202 [Ramaria rubella]|nr:hypothetical protein K439DRAFT_1641202 [Ramaria rubella]
MEAISVFLTETLLKSQNRAYMATIDPKPEFKDGIYYGCSTSILYCLPLRIGPIFH